MNLLAIGNSFTRDATRYIHGIAKADGIDITVISLAIGGCSLQQHYKHYMSDDKLYELWINGEYTEFFVTMKDALLNRDWDYVSIQQFHNLSVKMESYLPYMEEMKNIIKTNCPKGKLIMLEPWFPEPHNERLRRMGYEDGSDVCEVIHGITQKVAELVTPDVVIPASLILDKALSLGMENFYADGLHASLGVGRYMMALSWYKAITGRSVKGNTFRDFDVPVSEDEVLFAQRIVDEIIK